jgi:crossover junction endodeoxyribonuclease RuvC
MSRANARKLWAAKLSGKPLPAPTPVPTIRTGEQTTLRLGSRYEGIVLGIDPSLRGTGLAVVEAHKGKWRLLYSVTLKHPASMSLADCLGHIHKSVDETIARFGPSHIALEQTIYVQNSRTALTMGATRGAAISAAALRNLSVVEYPPARVKQAASGSGRASKEQVALQVKAILALPGILPPDESDAAAVCICHCLSARV